MPGRAPIPPLPGPEAATTLNGNVSHRTHPPGRLPRPKIPHHGRTRPLPPGRRIAPSSRADQTFALTLAHTGARISEILARAQPMDVDLDAGTRSSIRTLKRRAEALARDPGPTGAPPRPRARPFAPIDWAPESRRQSHPSGRWSPRHRPPEASPAIMTNTGIAGPTGLPQGPPSCLRYRRRLRRRPAAHDRSRPRPRQHHHNRDLHHRCEALRHGNFWHGCGPRSRIRPDPAPEGLRRGPVTRMAWAMTLKVAPPCELQTFLEPKKGRFERNSRGLRLKFMPSCRAAAVNSHSKPLSCKKKVDPSAPARH